jgi:uncharacterized protein DUF6498
MNGATPLAIAQTVAHNIVPLVGILAFHWSTANVLILYLLDTLLSIGVIIAGLMSSFAQQADRQGSVARLSAASVRPTTPPARPQRAPPTAVQARHRANAARRTTVVESGGRPADHDKGRVRGARSHAD